MFKFDLTKIYGAFQKYILFSDKLVLLHIIIDYVNLLIFFVGSKYFSCIIKTF